jgi:site-specific recombinase XerD
VRDIERELILLFCNQPSTVGSENVYKPLSKKPFSDRSVGYYVLSGVMTKQDPDQLEKFLSALMNCRPNSTVRSHRCAVQNVIRYHSEDGGCITEVTPTHVAEYIIANPSGYTELTQSGIVSCLSNYIAYTQQQNPDFVEIQIRREIRDLTQTNQPDTNQQQGTSVESAHGINAKEGREPELQAVELYLKYLRRCEYGTRTHAIVEIIVESNCRVKSVPQIHLSDLDLQQGTVSIWVSQKHVTPAYQYVISLSEDCISTLKTYCNHNRIVDSDGDTPELFRSAHGSISRSTIYRSIRDLSTQAIEYHSTTTETDVADCVEKQYPLTPINIRRYSLQNQTE